MTTPSVALREVEALAREIDKGLLATDERFNGMVQVHGQSDALVNVIPDAFALRHGGWYMIFSEHHGWFVHHCEEVWVIQYKRVNVEKYKENE